MQNILLKAQKIYFIGIGGSGMSGLARILKSQGKNITGSDQQSSMFTADLKKFGIKVHIGQKASSLPDKIDLVVYSPAVPATNPERIAAKHQHIPQYSYPQAVGLLTKTKKTICIAGTHGKTTTTAMTAAALIKAKKDPTVIVGASIHELQNHNARAGRGPHLILESCEYRRGFLNYHPSIIIITNIEADHLDYYKNLADYQKAFDEFTAKVPINGLIIANYDDSNVRAVLSKNPRVVWYGTKTGAAFQLQKNQIHHQGKIIATLNLKIPGQHNLMNATAVIALSKSLKLPLSKITAALNNYHGSSRRFEIKGKIGKTIIIDDYGHHPTEIQATLQAVREKYGKNKKVLCIFQPHQYSRTYKLLHGFATSFSNADKIIIPNIYQVRDSKADLRKINTQLLVKKIAANHPHVQYGHGLQKTLQQAKKELHNFDIIITMGAGDIVQVSNALIKKSAIKNTAKKTR